MPRDQRILPLCGDVAQRQPDQLRSGLIVGEVAFVADALSDLAVQAFDGIGGVDHLAYWWGKREERDHLLPVSAPALRRKTGSETYFDAVSRKNRL